MFNLLQTASDDQTAIGACILTLVGAAFFMFVSFHLGPAGQKLRSQGQTDLNSKKQAPTKIRPDQSHERAA